MMPRPLCHGGFDTLPLDPSLGALWLREILKECAPWDAEFPWSDVATHSLKATLLSFMAKAAAPENLRSIAGYHMRSLNSSTLKCQRFSGCCRPDTEHENLHMSKSANHMLTIALGYPRGHKA